MGEPIGPCTVVAQKSPHPHHPENRMVGIFFVYLLAAFRRTWLVLIWKMSLESVLNASMRCCFFVGMFQLRGDG